MSIPSSTTRWVWKLEVQDLTGAELTETIQRFRRVGKEIQGLGQFRRPIAVTAF
jgi:hypothetical protein